MNVMSDIPSGKMIWAKINGVKTGYVNENKARLDVAEYCVANKCVSVLFYDSKESHFPFGEMLCFEKEDRPVWFALSDCDDRHPDTGFSEGPFSINDDGSIN